MRVNLGDGAWFELTKAWLHGPFTPPDVFDRIRTTTPWAERAVRIGQREIMQPRLVAWMAYPGSIYRYSGTDNVPSAWTPTVSHLMGRLLAIDLDFNACFLNLYRDGRDSIGWHADDESIFGEHPTIASLSLGARRRFRIRPKGGGATRELVLDDGDLLVMGGTMQERWEHSVPKEPGALGERINLTFRWVGSRTVQQTPTAGG